MHAYLLLFFSLLVCTNAIRYKTVITEITILDENYTLTEDTYELTEILNENRAPILLG
jgi:hypothetical protein